MTLSTRRSPHSDTARRRTCIYDVPRSQLDVLDELFLRLRRERAWAVHPGIGTPDRVSHRSLLRSLTGATLYPASTDHPLRPVTVRAAAVSGEAPRPSATLSLFRQSATATTSTRADRTTGNRHGLGGPVQRRRSGGDDRQRAVVGFEGGAHALGVALARARDRLAALGHELDALLRRGAETTIALVEPVRTTTGGRDERSGRRSRAPGSYQVTPGRKLRRPAGGMTRKQTTTAGRAAK
jgi:hypothetical protein